MNIDNAPEGYAIERITIENPNKKFFILPPKELIEHRSFNCYVDTDLSFNGSDNFSDLPDEIRDRIEPFRKFVAKLLLNGRMGYKFNAKSFGILSFNYSRTGLGELNTLNLEVYESDFFTKQVLHLIYRDLFESGKIEIQSQDDIQAHPLVKFLLPSLGVNAVVETPDRFILITKRSARVVNSPFVRYHISMNEGLSISDYDSTYKRPSISECLKRGLEEELGIKREFDPIESFAFYNLFFIKEIGELGISAHVKLVDNPIFYADKIPELAPISKDGAFEFEGKPIPVVFGKREIQEFIKNSFKEAGKTTVDDVWVPHGLYVLMVVCAYKNIFV
ncbi:MAG: hypothetical protein H5T73_12805 [Actinobacteria bacterium]|nr:hypothetical protein [Actinomycetota bacterium]